MGGYVSRFRAEPGALPPMGGYVSRFRAEPGASRPIGGYVSRFRAHIPSIFSRLRFLSAEPRGFSHLERGALGAAHGAGPGREGGCGPALGQVCTALRGTSWKPRRTTQVYLQSMDGVA